MRSYGILAFFLPLVVGCGDGDKFVPVSGRVTLNGEPASGVAVSFQPTERSTAEPGPGSSALTDADGRFTLTLIGHNKQGASPGKHSVIIMVPVGTRSDSEGARKSKEPSIPARYNKDTKLTFDVPAKGTTSADFELTSP